MVPANGYHVHEVLGEQEAAQAHAVHGSIADLIFRVGESASANVHFPCGMNWIVQENTNVTVETYRYDGQEADTHTARLPFDSPRLPSVLQAIGATRGVTTWRARLVSGSIEHVALRAQNQSSQTFVSDEGEFTMRAHSSNISRDPSGGTTVDVIAGQASATLKDGRTVRIREGFRVKVSPDGQVTMNRLPPRRWVHFPAEETATPVKRRVVMMPVDPDLIISVSKS